jgi:alkylation response protein AidB-like acyl-CoA dehydrogenase
MTSEELISRLRPTLAQTLPRPGAGHTTERHRRLFEIGRQDLSLARLAETHWDAIAILAEAGNPAETDVLYGVWAAEIPGAGGLELSCTESGFAVTGKKMFASGAALVDRALVTVVKPEHRLIDIDLRLHRESIFIDEAGWKSAAFAATRTATVTFRQSRIREDDIVGPAGWYLDRPGFWHGACGPAACWAGGAAGLVDFALLQARDDPHTLAHRAAMRSSVWAMESFLETAGRETDVEPKNSIAAKRRALTVRHLVEQACSEILSRFARAYGPYPLAMNEEIARRRHELDLYVRQSHAERDLEVLGRLDK